MGSKSPAKRVNCTQPQPQPQQEYVKESGLVGLENYDLNPDSLELFSLLMLGQVVSSLAVYSLINSR